jgi:hypothetical protein
MLAAAVSLTRPPLLHLMVRRNNTGTDQLARVKLLYCFLTMQSVHFSCTII